MPIFDQLGNPVSDPFEELDALFKKYGFTGRPGANQAAIPLEAAQGGTGVGDFSGLSADPRFAALTQQLGLNNIHPVTPQERSGMMDPNGPGNGEGGSTLQNLGLGASFLLGGSGIAGMLGAPGLTGAQSLGQLAGFGGGASFTPPSGLSNADDALDAFQGSQMDFGTGGQVIPGSGIETLNGGGYSGATSTAGTGVQTAGADFSPLTSSGLPAATAGGAALSALGTGAGQAAAGTALQRILNGTGTAADFASVLGTGGAALLGAGVANKQTDAFKTLSDQFIGMGAPSRARYEASYAPGFTMSDDPGYMDSLNQSAKAATHAMSIGGNPAASPNAWTQTLQDLQQRTAYPALQQYRNQNAATGGIANFSSAVPGAATTAIQSQSAAPNVLSAGLSDIFNPKPSQTQLLSQFSSLFGRG